MFTRMEGFYIDGCRTEKFDAVDFRDEKGGRVKVEGKTYHIDYATRGGSTPPSGLQVLRNYEDAVKAIGGVRVFQAEYETWLRLDKAGGTFWVYVDSWHGGGKGETYGITIVEKEAMAQEVVADAKSLKSDIEGTGHASVYGIHFEFDRADIKPESEPAIDEIAKLLHQNPRLKVYLVGHTDNAGTLDYNMRLSRARAEAVVKDLVTRHRVSSERLRAYGVGSLAPVASNKTDDGRARNRRVELVEQ
jgi:outer membrane protein OmpA-like peptidoglycan-associated protein